MLSASPSGLAESLQEKWAPLEIEFHRAYWDSQVEASAATESRRVELELELRRAKGDTEAFAAVTAALDEEVHDPVTRRQLEVLRASFTGNQMDEKELELMVDLSSSIENDFAAYRPEVDGRRLSDNEIERLLKTSDDQQFRRRVWEASKEVGAVVAPRIRELVRLRNQAAHRLGFADYYRMSLELQELTEPWLFEVLDNLEVMTNDMFGKWKGDLDDRLRARFQTTDLYPWHYSDPFFQALPLEGRVSLDGILKDVSAAEVAQKTFAGWGIDLSGVMKASDIYPREQKCQHAFCIDVDRSGKDVRILANVVPGERWVEVMLHESGHAAYDISIDPYLPYLLRRAAHTFVTEAIAIMSGRLVRDPRWLTEIAGVPFTEVEPIAKDLRRSTAAQSLLFARWGLVMTYFERELYADPEADLDSIWWELVERFQLIAPPNDRMAPDWASKIHIAVAPAYYHNYLLGELFASQVRTTAEQKFGSLVGSDDVGALLIESIFSKGSSAKWDALVEEAVGGPLSAEHFAKDLDVW